MRVLDREYGLFEPAYFEGYWEKDFFLTTKIEFVMGYKRMKKKKDRLSKGVDKLRKSIVKYAGLLKGERFMWFESPNAEWYLDM